MAKERRRSLFDFIMRRSGDRQQCRYPGAWLYPSWPWWLALGIMVVPFLASLHLFESLLLLIVLGGLWCVFPALRTGLIAAILVLSGAIWGTIWGQHTLDNRLPEVLIKKDVWAVGTIQGLPQLRARALRFKFNIESLEYQTHHFDYSGQVLLNWYKPFPELKSGQRWRLRLRLKPAHGSLNPGGFNYEKWLFSQGIRATGYVRDSKLAVMLESAAWRGYFDRLRAQIQVFIDRQDLQYGGLLNALAVGVRSGINEQQWQVFRDTGTAHLIAISGLHIGMVAGIVYFLAYWLWQKILLRITHFPAQKFARLMAVLAAVVYAALAGFSLPTVRALLMLLAYFTLQWLRRNPDRLFSLGFVLFVVLLFNPLAPLGSGFWLSFSAVAAIALATGGRQAGAMVKQTASAESEVRPSGDRPSVGLRIGSWFGQWWRVQWAIFIGLLPLSLLFFQQVSMVTLFANFVAIPLVASAVVPLILLALIVLFSGFPEISAQLLGLADTLLGGLWPVLRLLSEQPVSVWATAAPPAWVVLLCSAGAVLLLSPVRGKVRWLGALAFLPLFMQSSIKLEPGAFTLHVLDVGQGLAVVVETRNHALLYDAGVRFPAGFDAGADIVLPFLRQRRMNTLDVVVVSHDNLDHYGGMASVLHAQPDANRYSSGGFYATSSPCVAGQRWRWDDVGFSFIHPSPGNIDSDNNASCVLKVQSQYGGVLLTADIERKTEVDLLQNARDELRGIDVLMVPHHGSKTSSSAAFIDALKPKLAVISAGYLNRFKHPRPEVMRRYTERNIPLLNTANSGWIEIQFNRDGWAAIPWRSLYKRYWLEAKNSTRCAPECLRHSPVQ